MSDNNENSGLRTFVYLVSVGFLAITFFVISGLKKYNEHLFDVGYNVNVQKINENLLLMSASGVDYFYSPMYCKDDENISYDETSGEFLKKYFELRKYCGTTPDGCFASKYKDLNKKLYKPEFKGACAILKNGTSICLVPQISDNNITGIMDMNASKGPNIYGKDLRDFEIKARRTYVHKEKDPQSVITVP